METAAFRMYSTWGFDFEKLNKTKLKAVCDDYDIPYDSGDQKATLCTKLCKYFANVRRRKGEEFKGFLNPNFKSSSLRAPQLRSLLAEYDIDVPSTGASVPDMAMLLDEALDDIRACNGVGLRPESDPATDSLMDGLTSNLRSTKLQDKHQSKSDHNSDSDHVSSSRASGRTTNEAKAKAAAAELARQVLYAEGSSATASASNSIFTSSPPSDLHPASMFHTRASSKRAEGAAGPSRQATSLEKLDSAEVACNIIEVRTFKLMEAIRARDKDASVQIASWLLDFVDGL